MHKDQQNKKTCNQFCKPITGLFSTKKCSCQRVINSDTCTYFYCCKLFFHLRFLAVRSRIYSGKLAEGFAEMELIRVADFFTHLTDGKSGI